MASIKFEDNTLVGTMSIHTLSKEGIMQELKRLAAVLDEVVKFNDLNVKRYRIYAGYNVPDEIIKSTLLGEVVN